MKKALIYCRVSTDEQAKEGLSLGIQEELCTEFAKKNDYNVLKVYRDEGKSATNTNRAGLKEMLIECKENESINAVIIQDTSRISRNTGDYFTIIKAVLRETDVKLISINQPNINDETPEGRLIDTMFSAVNQFHSDIDGFKVRKSLQKKFENGWWPGWAPLGYTNGKIGEDSDKTKSKKIIKKDPTKWYLIKEGFKMYLTGNYSALEIAEKLSDKGLTGKNGGRVSNSVMISILQNPFYYGLMIWKGQEKIGNHPRMIEKEEHQRIVAIAKAHGGYACRRRKHNFLLRGLVLCGICGARYTAEKHRQGKNVDYYHCTTQKKKHSNRGQNVDVKNLETQVEKKFKEIQFSTEFIDLVVKKVKNFYEERKGETENKKRVLLNRKLSLEKKRDGAEEKLIAGVLEDDDFIRVKSKIKSEINIIQSQIDGLEVKHDIDIDVIRDALMLSKNIYKSYKKSPYEIKRLYLSFFWKNFWVQDKTIVKAEPTDLMKVLLQDKQIIIKGNWQGW